MKVIQHSQFPLTFYEKTLSNGMKVTLVPRSGFNTIKTILHVQFGLRDEANSLKTSKGWQSLPQGTAHFLEHRIFESKGEHLMRYFAKHGASINASTGTLATQYYFSTIRDFPELLTYFLNFIQNYQDTEAGIKKEAGIIQREYVRRYESESSKIDLRMKQVSYPNHHLSREILGTQSSISNMTRDDLALAYQHYYRPSNLTLVIVGNIDVENTQSLIEGIQKSFPNRDPLPSQPFYETTTIQTTHSFHEEQFDVSMPEDHFIIKFPPYSSTMEFHKKNRESTIVNILRRMLLNSNAPLYLKWQKDRLLESSLTGSYYHVTDSYAMWSYKAHTKKPKELFEALQTLFQQPWDDQLMEPLFIALKNSSIGLNYTDINSISGIANEIVDSASKQEPYLVNLSVLPTIQYKEVKNNYHQIINYSIDFFHIKKSMY